MISNRGKWWYPLFLAFFLGKEAFCFSVCIFKLCFSIFHGLRTVFLGLRKNQGNSLVLWCYVFQHWALGHFWSWGVLGSSWVAFGFPRSGRAALGQGSLFSFLLGRFFCGQNGHQESAQMHKNTWFFSLFLNRGLQQLATQNHPFDG